MWESIIRAVNDVEGSNGRIYFTPHQFRRTYATKLYMANVDAKTTQYVMGHSDISVTLGIYTHIKEGNIGLIADKISDVF